MKGEVQQKIIENPEKKKVSEEEFYSMLKIVSPGTGLRAALEGIINAGKGALIAVENEFLEPLTDGGFRVNSKFTPQKIIELSKMDGAIIVSRDFKRIIAANVLLTPDSRIKTTQTGTRHKAGERTAKQISGLVIAVSERRKEIMIFYKEVTYRLRSTAEILRKANEYLQVLEKQRELFDIYLESLNKYELKNYVNLNQAIRTIQKGKVIQKISQDLRRYLIELGNEGKLFETRLKEILYDVIEETNLIIRDYSAIDYKESTSFLDSLSYEELLDKERILKALNHESIRKIVPAAGWRMLSKTSLTEDEIAKVVNGIGFDKIITSGIEESPNEGIISKDKFSSMKVELERIKLGI
jgi:diadenylate cyclase